MSGAHVPDVHVSKTIKCENPFPNWKPITKISYLELDIIVSRLVYSKAINWLMESSNINIINHFWRLILMIHTCLIDELLCMINNAIALSMLLSFREWVNTIIKIQKTNIFYVNVSMQNQWRLYLCFNFPVGSIFFFCQDFV